MLCGGSGHGKRPPQGGGVLPARYSGCFLFDYYKDGAEVPRDPRAAVRYWMRDMCYQYHLELWNVILSLTASLEDCGTRPYSEQLRLLFGEVWQNVENSF